MGFHTGKFLILIVISLIILAFTDSKPLAYFMYVVITASVFFIIANYMTKPGRF